jgi:cysteinyl-tRNA synthetase
MTLKFYNTLTGQIDEFVSVEANKAKIYSCGPTVYSYPHIGNWAAYIYWDTLVRILKLNDYAVTRVMNITDVGHLTSDADNGEDKLQVGARREGKTAWDLAKFYTDYFLSGINRLNITMPDYITKATEYISQQQDLIRTLKTKGFTYQTSDGIYFDTAKFPTYADFAKLNIDEQKAGARVEFNPEKRNPSDFAVWKFSPKNEKRDMEWPTPTDLLTNPTDKIVMGFPGWHIECSAMAMSILGNTIDIHTGGIDAIPVHHTNEIAQSESATGVRFSNYWLHNNFMMVNGTKISKSLGNVFTLEDIEEKGYSLLDFRMLVLQGSYRNEGNFTFEALDSAKNRLNNWKNTATLRHQIHNTIDNGEENNEITPSYAVSQAIVEAISDDLGTPKALKIIDDAFSILNKTPLANINRQSLLQLLETIDLSLGLKLVDSTPDISDEAKQLIIERRNAREQKDWAKADKLRNILLESNIILRDTSHDSIWEYQAK